MVPSHSCGTRTKAKVNSPISRPARAAAKRPLRVTPPLVPRGTVFERLVMSLGLVGERMPSSELKVSPRQAEKLARLAVRTK